jgi:recombination protein RecT
MNTQVKEKTKTDEVAKPAESKGEVATQKPPSPVAVLRQQMEKQKPEFELVLGPGVTVDRFVRTIMTAVQADPDLLLADRTSLLQAAMQAAQDGLLPDKREGAFVLYNTKVKDNNGNEGWIKMVQWMPMIRGIIKKAREGGEIATMAARVVYEHDEFEYVLGDDERIMHKPTMQSRGKLIACYAIAKMKDGECEREVMTAEDVTAVRSASKSKTGPWTGPFESEMWRKSVIRRLLKRLPMTPILEQIINRDESHYEFKDGRGMTWAQRPALEAPSPPKRSDFTQPQADGPNRTDAEDIDGEEEDHAGVSEAAQQETSDDSAAQGETGEQAEPSFVEQSIAHLATLNTVSGISRWYDNTFLEEAHARELSEDDIKRVETAKIARLKEAAAKK